MEDPRSPGDSPGSSEHLEILKTLARVRDRPPPKDPRAAGCVATIVALITLVLIPFIGPALEEVMPAFVTQGMGINFQFGGTSLLIVVGVAMDTVQQIESQLVMRNYDGFMKRGRIRGRR